MEAIFSLLMLIMPLFITGVVFSRIMRAAVGKPKIHPRPVEHNARQMPALDWRPLYEIAPVQADVPTVYGEGEGEMYEGLAVASSAMDESLDQADFAPKASPAFDAEIIRQAVVWAEVLGRPVSQRPTRFR